MKARNVLIILSIYCFFLPVVAHARLCTEVAKDWNCFGQINIKMSQDDGPQKPVISRMAFFNNHEELVQLEADDKVLQYLFVPSNVVLYSGIIKNGHEKEEIDQLLLAAPIYLNFPMELLGHAYPLGPESVPGGKCTKTFGVYGGEPSYTITTTRSGSGHITFLIKDEKKPLSFSGNWDSELAEPYPDDFTLSGWNYNGEDVLRKLSDARSLAISASKLK